MLTVHSANHPANQPLHTSFSIWHSYCYCYIAKKQTKSCCSFNMPFDLNDGWKREIFITKNYIIWLILLFVSLFILTVARNRSDHRKVLLQRLWHEAFIDQRHVEMCDCVRQQMSKRKTNNVHQMQWSFESGQFKDIHRNVFSKYQEKDN